jgi:hypothetical protein
MRIKNVSVAIRKKKNMLLSIFKHMYVFTVMVIAIFITLDITSRLSLLTTQEGVAISECSVTGRPGARGRTYTGQMERDRSSRARIYIA